MQGLQESVFRYQCGKDDCDDLRIPDSNNPRKIRQANSPPKDLAGVMHASEIPQKKTMTARNLPKRILTRIYAMAG